jgi:hypothetical protein
MRVLLDKNVHHKLRHALDDEFEVETVQCRGWDGIRNGDLLELAESSFDAMLTAEGSMEHQQNISGFDIAIVILSAHLNRCTDLAPMVRATRLRDTDPSHATLVSA